MHMDITIKTFVEVLDNDRKFIKQEDGDWREETDQELKERLMRKYRINRKNKLSRYSQTEENK